MSWTKEPVEKRLRILSLPVDDGGCGHYRVRQNLYEISRQELAETYILKGTEGAEELARYTELADIIIARNGTGPLIRAVKAADPLKPIIFDHDDNTFAILPSNEHYRDHGTRDVHVTLPDGTVQSLWVTGVDGFDRYANIWKSKELEFSLEAADLNTSPVRTLSDLWGEYNNKAAIVPNYIDFALYPEVTITDPTKGNEFRIGWHGGASHAADIQTIVSPLKKFLHEHKSSIFYSIGMSWPKMFTGYENRIRSYPWLPFKAHPFRLASLALDVGVIPLQDASFNDFKSEVKFSEFAAARIPVLVANRLPYSEVCKDGVNCLTYKTENEFFAKLKKLKEDSNLRRKLVENAYKWVKKERNLEIGAREIFALYSAVHSKEV